MYNQAAFRFQQGKDDVRTCGMKNDDLAGDVAYEDGWGAGLREMRPLLDAYHDLLDLYGADKVDAVHILLVQGD